jgi:hypothetical protein
LVLYVLRIVLAYRAAVLRVIPLANARPQGRIVRQQWSVVARQINVYRIQLATPSVPPLAHTKENLVVRRLIVAMVPT